MASGKPTRPLTLNALPSPPAAEERYLSANPKLSRRGMGSARHYSLHALSLYGRTPACQPGVVEAGMAFKADATVPS